MAGKRVDITGKKFGKLTAIEYSHTDNKRQAVWRCKCDCGKEINATAAQLNAGRIKSCGCGRAAGVQSAKKADKIYGTSIGHIKNGTLFKTNRSGCRGVSWNNRSQKWQATIKIHGKQIYLGLHEDLNEAIAARKKAEKEYFAPILEKYKEDNMSTIVDLIRDALNREDYEFRINFLIAGLISEESNDTPAKVAVNKAHLIEIKDFLDSVDEPHREFLKRTSGRIEQYIKQM